MPIDIAIPSDYNNGQKKSREISEIEEVNNRTT